MRFVARPPKKIGDSYEPNLYPEGADTWFWVFALVFTASVFAVVVFQ